MKNKKIYVLIIFVLIFTFVFSGCKDDKPNPEPADKDSSLKFERSIPENFSFHEKYIFSDKDTIYAPGNDGWEKADSKKFSADFEHDDVKEKLEFSYLINGDELTINELYFLDGENAKNASVYAIEGNSEKALIAVSTETKAIDFYTANLEDNTVSELFISKKTDIDAHYVSAASDLKQVVITERIDFDDSKSDKYYIYESESKTLTSVADFCKNQDITSAVFYKNILLGYGKDGSAYIIDRKTGELSQTAASGTAQNEGIGSLKSYSWTFSEKKLKINDFVSGNEFELTFDAPDLHSYDIEFYRGDTSDGRNLLMISYIENNNIHIILTDPATGKIIAEVSYECKDFSSPHKASFDELPNGTYRAFIVYDYTSEHQSHIMCYELV